MILKKPTFKSFCGFSLIEVSVAILIIGILIAGIAVADKMVDRFRIAAAQTLSNSSPINSITEVALWLETSLSESFDESEASTGRSVTNWNDQKKSSVNKVAIICNATAGCPTYSNTINRVHAVEFANAGF